jgi:hypothetical protein
MLRKTLIFITFLVSLNAFGQIDTVYVEKLRDLVEIAEMQKSYEVITRKLIDTYKTRNPEVDEIFWNELYLEINNRTSKDLAKLFLPLYQKYFSIEDIENMIEFYKTPTGQKYVDNMPALISESVNLGQLWGIEIGKQIRLRLKSTN